MKKKHRLQMKKKHTSLRIPSFLFWPVNGSHSKRGCFGCNTNRLHAITPNPPNPVCYSRVRGCLHRTSSTVFMLGSMRRTTVYWSSGAVNGLRHHRCGRWCRRNTQGVRIPSSTIQRAWHRIGNRKRRAMQPVSNAYEDAAQTIGGRNTHGDKSGRG